RSRSRERDVVQSQSCGFFLFSSCSVLLSTARRADQRSAGGAHFRFFSGGLEETRNAGLCPAACFSPVIYRKKTGPAGGRLRTLPQAARITTSRVSAGARLRDYFRMALLPLFRSREREAELEHRVYALQAALAQCKGVARTWWSMRVRFTV